MQLCVIVCVCVRGWVLECVTVSFSSQLSGCGGHWAWDSWCNDIYPGEQQNSVLFSCMDGEPTDLARLKQAFPFKSIFSTEVIWLVHSKWAGGKEKIISVLRISLRLVLDVMQRKSFISLRWPCVLAMDERPDI